MARARKADRSRLADESAGLPPTTRKPKPRSRSVAWKRNLGRATVAVVSLAVVAACIVAVAYVVPRMNVGTPGLETSHLPLDTELLVHVDWARLQNSSDVGAAISQTWAGAPLVRDVASRPDARPPKVRTLTLAVSPWKGSKTYEERAATGLLVDRNGAEDPEERFVDLAAPGVGPALLSGLGLIAAAEGDPGPAATRGRLRWTAVVRGDGRVAAGQSSEEDVLVWEVEPGEVVLGNTLTLRDARRLEGGAERSYRFDFVEAGHAVTAVWLPPRERRDQARAVVRDRLAAVPDLPPRIATLLENVQEGTTAVALSADFADSTDVLLQMQSYDVGRAARLEKDASRLLAELRTWSAAHEADDLPSRAVRSLLTGAKIVRSGTTIDVRGSVPSEQSVALLGAFARSLWLLTAE